MECRSLYRGDATQDLRRKFTDFKAEVTAPQEIRWLGKVGKKQYFIETLDKNSIHSTNDNVHSSPTSTKKHGIHQTESPKQINHVLCDMTEGTPQMFLM
uniref:Uncharacterized protein n=1 Tax=Megaselia scalaris TaxID=36166 RepID=T1GI44_MEGSC